jgi:hypothetical protein
MIDEITIKRAAEAGLPAAEAHPDPPLMAFPLRSEWDVLHPAGRELWPEPEMVNRPVAAERRKTALAELDQLATQHGWRVHATEAKGAWPSVGQKPSVQRWSVRLGMSRGQERAVAVYVEDATGKTWKWDTLQVWRLGGWPTKYADIGMFKDTVFGLLCKLAWPGKGDWSCPWFGPVHGPEKPRRVP